MENNSSGLFSPAYSQSETIAELAKALGKVQAEMPAVPKGQENPFFHSKYADLSSIWEAIRPLLAKHDLAIIQLPTNGGLTTTILHTSGEWVRATMDMELTKANNPQAQGSAITYARRYMLQGAVGVCTVDDDGEVAMSRKEPDWALEVAAKQKAIRAVKTAPALVKYWNTNGHTIETMPVEHKKAIMGELSKKRAELKKAEGKAASG
jgi:hypothetical protein